MISLYIKEWDNEDSENCEVDLEAHVVDSGKFEKGSRTNPQQEAFVVYEFTWEKHLYSDLQNKIISEEIEKQFDKLQEQQLKEDAKLHSHN